MSYRVMVKHQQPGTRGAGVVHPWRKFTDSSRYTDEGNVHRVRGSQLLLLSVSILLSTALAATTIGLVGFSFSLHMLSRRAILQWAVALPGFCASIILAIRAGVSWQAMKKNRKPDAPGSKVFYSLRDYHDSSRYTDEGNFHRVRGNRFFYLGVAVLLGTGLVVQLIALAEP
jgi:hypothetical protein